jgi:hypothetical protein
MAQGRVNVQTRVQRLGDSAWLPLSAFPEFSGLAQLNPPFPSLGPLRTNPLAQTGFIFGICSVTVGFCCCYGTPFNLLGLVFSLVGLAQINAHPQEQQGRGLAITGIVLSSLSLLTTVLAWLLHGAYFGLRTVHPRIWHI